MKRILLPILTMVLIFASCDKTETFDDTRKNDNEMQFAKIAADPAYKKIESKSGNGFIMYKVIKEGEIDPDQMPIFTDNVKTHYTGWYKRFWTKEDTFIDDNGFTFQNKIIFDTTAIEGSETEKSSEFSVSKVVDGFSTALQHMHVGDKWEIWIPWQLGYGAYDYSAGGISAYSTLVFELELVEIVK